MEFTREERAKIVDEIIKLRENPVYTLQQIADRGISTLVILGEIYANTFNSFRSSPADIALTAFTQGILLALYIRDLELERSLKGNPSETPNNL